MADTMADGIRESDEMQTSSNQSLSKLGENEIIITETPLQTHSSRGVDESMDCPEVESNENSFKSPNTFVVPLSISSQSKKPKRDVGKGKDVSVIEDKESASVRDGLKQGANYQEPEWSGEAEEEYSFDVLKNGTIIDNISLLGKPFFIFGRLQSCDVTLEHPSLSRYHAVIQYSKDATPTHEKGWYVYDLDSTHGTWVNKRKVNPKVYHRIKVGHIVKFGGSSRLHILQGPQDDTEAESEMSITEMKEQKERQHKEAEILRQIETQEEKERAEKERKVLEDQGCGWGIGEDAEEVGDENPIASLVSENEHLYIDDPKKALKGFYEREGIDLPDYQFTETSAGSHKCRLEIPVDGPNGEELVAEAVVSGKKKDSVVACALEACRMLDKLGMLRSSNHESRKRKGRNWEDNDYYDSDEDTFLDRTGTIEKKRTMRMKKAGKEASETYESLVAKYTKATERIQEIEAKLEKARAETEALANEDMDELDAYMVSIKSGIMDTKTRLSLKGELLRLKMDEQNLRRLVNIAKPASLPPLKPLPAATGDKMSTTENLSRKLQHGQQIKQRQRKQPLPMKHAVVEIKPDNYEEQEQDDEEENGKEQIDIIDSTSLNSRLNAAPHELNTKEHESKRLHEKTPSNTLPSETTNTSVKKRNPRIDLESPTDQKEIPQSKTSKYFSTSAALETMDRQQTSSKTSVALKSKPQVNLDTLDPKFATWLPPTEQTGDGRTSLNDKFGY